MISRLTTTQTGRVLTRARTGSRTAGIVFVAACAALLVIGTPTVARAVSTRDLIELSKAGLGDEVLVALIEADGTVFNLDAPKILELRAAGVSERVITAMLATFIGLGVITRVSRLLHTPLMSLTNAISAIAVVGAILVAGPAEYPTYITVLGAIALFASMTNIVSGFLITDRMLKMFKKEPGK